MSKKTAIDTGLADKARKTILAKLDALLADEVLLYLKTRNFHWNVEGPLFHPLHKFFEEQYEALDEIMDDVAERARALDGAAAGSMGTYLKLARLKETDVRLDAPAMLGALLADHETVVRQLRKDAEAVSALGDAGTEDFLVGLIETHEKMAWMLRAQLR